MSSNSIKYLHRDQIDTAKWDECIQQSTNGLLYATSEYLDCITRWDALVQNDYEAVMPLPWRKKFGFQYLYQPAFCQQLGIFSKSGPNLTISDRFLDRIPSSYALWDIQLNATNVINKYNAKLRKNYLLSLNASYEELNKEYSRSAKRNIAKAAHAGVTISGNVDSELVVQLHRQRFGATAGIHARDYENFRQLFSRLQKARKLFSIAAVNSSEEVIASSNYLFYKDRLTFVMNGNLPEVCTMEPPIC